MKQRRVVMLLSCLMLLALTACDLGRGQTTAPQPIPTPEATAQATVDSRPPTAEPTLLPPATLTVTPHPTITPGPSPTPDSIALLVATVEPRLNAVLPSPDGLKRAEVWVYDCAPLGEGGQPVALELLRVVEPATGTELQAATQRLACGGLGAFGLEPLAWGADGRTLWYTGAREGGPDGACRAWVRPVVRLDTVEMTQNEINEAAASADGAKVAGWVEGELVVYSIDGAELGRSAPPALPPYVGPPAWSPDGSALAYVQYSSFCGEAAGESALVLVDATTYSPRVLATQTGPEFDAVSWPDATHLSVSGLMGQGRWEYDLLTGTLTRVE